jgi:hypothetical protein
MIKMNVEWGLLMSINIILEYKRDNKESTHTGARGVQNERNKKDLE